MRVSMKLSYADKTTKRGILRALAQDLWRHRGLYLLLLIPVLYLLIFRYIPMYGAQIAFRDYQPARGIWGSQWVGFRYVSKFFGSYMFSRVVRNTLTLSFYTLVTFPLPLVLAILLHYIPSRRFKKTVQLVSYAPHFISTVVMCGMVLQFLDTRNGPINAFITLFGASPISFMAQPTYFRTIYVWSGVWQGVGFSAIIYISALSGVSPELHEAAIVDGATILKRIWHIDIPGILPMVCVLLVLNCGSLLNVGFEKVLLLQNNLNLQVSEIISTYVYKQGLANALPNYSYSTAIGLFVSIVNLVLLVSVNTITKRMSGNALW